MSPMQIAPRTTDSETDDVFRRLKCGEANNTLSEIPCHAQPRGSAVQLGVTFYGRQICQDLESDDGYSRYAIHDLHIWFGNQ